MELQPNHTSEGKKTLYPVPVPVFKQEKEQEKQDIFLFDDF